MIVAVILAAGESARLGRPKQLLEYRGKTLIGHAIEAARSSSCDEIIVVVGAHADAITKELERYPVRIVNNPNWKEGKASSIRAAVNAESQQPEVCSGILFMTCDQPYLPVSALKDLLDRFRVHGNRPVATAYANTIGIPAVIPRRLFGKLMELTGDQGAQAILQALPGEVSAVACAQGSFDVDCPNDLEQLHADG